MNLVNQYIVQSIITASNNLRLSSEKIEVVAQLREYLLKSPSIEKDIKEMKKVTSLSKLAIKLDDLNRYISNSKIDFLKISDKFKEHSHSLIRDLSNILDVVTPNEMRQIITSLGERTNRKIENTNHKAEPKVDDIKINRPKAEMNIAEESKYTEQFIMDDIKDNEEIDFEEFEKAVLKPVKEIDGFFKQLENLNFTMEELKNFHEILSANKKLSEKVGFDIITNMHKIICKALEEIRENNITPMKETVEGMRACLIVIVAVVRQKDVDITGYLKKAEKFGKTLITGRGKY